MAENSTEQDNKIHQAAGILREGGLIAFPTETYYGLAVDPFNETALQRLFVIKNRPSVKPVLVLVPSRDQLSRLTDTIPVAASILMDRFWPGPLTMVFSARPELPNLLTGGTGTIGARLSPHPVARKLLQVYGGPLTATSANRGGGEPAATEEEVFGIFGEEVDMILGGGRTSGTKPSTLVGFAGDSILCLREGQILCSEIRRHLQARRENQLHQKNEN